MNWFEHGGFWNPHHWRETSENTRICSKCGLCQTKDNFGGNFDWRYHSFDYLQSRVVKDKVRVEERNKTNARLAELHKEQLPLEEEDRRKALAFLKEFEGE